jgi:AcrR family transcriptional regulator
MNQMTFDQPKGVVVSRPNLRDAAKIVTRGQLIASARARFLDLGYEATTLRDIAADAGRSVGAVFNSFSDKLELLEAVLADEAVGLGEAARAAISRSSDFADMLYRMHNLMIEPSVARLVLIDRHLPPERRAVQPALHAVLTDAAIEARDRGEIVPHIQPNLICGLIWDLLAARCQNILDDPAEPGASLSITRDRIDLLMTALRP